MCLFSPHFVQKNDSPSESGANGKYKPTILIWPTQSGKPLRASQYECASCIHSGISQFPVIPIYQDSECSCGFDSACSSGKFVVSIAGEAYASKPEIQIAYSS
jgi:hypothetical protein